MTAPPPFFLGAVLLLWGALNGFLPLAVVMAAVLEAPRYLLTRWDLSDRDFDHLVDFTSLLWVGTAVYLFVELSVHGLFTLLSLMPLMLFLLVLAQVYSLAQNIRLSSLFFSLRRVAARDDLPLPMRQTALRRVDVRYAYLLLCLISASISKSPWFLPAIYLLAAWGLWHYRVRRYPLWLWLGALSLALGLAYSGQVGIFQLQRQVERWVLTWLEDLMLPARDPYQQTTAIGDLGELKLSNRVVLRVKSDGPLRLREASYNSYNDGKWRTRYTQFSKLHSLSDDYTWRLAAPPRRSGVHATAQIARYLNKGQGMLALPQGSYLLNLKAGPGLESNPFGAFKLSAGPDLLDYTVHYADFLGVDGPPEQADLELPPKEAEFLRQLAAELGLPGLPPAQAVARLEDWFAREFRYSLQLNAVSLRQFLATERSGHCEYFATATTLLLRAAGIPSRYAVGYMAEEYSLWEDTFLARLRHAHAWSLAYLDGRWQEVDTTPADWVETEAEQQAPWWESLYDLSAWLYYQYAKFVWREAEAEDNLNWVWLLPLLLLLGWRLRSRRRRVQRAGDAPAGSSPPVPPGQDSAVYALLQALERVGHPRPPGQALRPWLLQVGQVCHLPAAELAHLLRLHNRYRFDPHGLSPAERAELERSARAGLRRLQT